MQFVSTTFTTFLEGWPNLLCHKLYNEQERERTGTCKARQMVLELGPLRKTTEAATIC